MGKYYILDKLHRARPVDLLVWGRWFDDANNRRVAQTVLKDGKVVSTVFLGIDYNYLPTGKPLIFETMVFPSAIDLSELDLDRYQTWSEAVKGHKRLVKKWSLAHKDKPQY